MKNILEIFEALDPNLEIRKNLKLTENIFSQKKKKSNLPSYSLNQMIKLIDQLESEGPISLSNGSKTINFMTLMEIMETNKIHHLQSTSSLIRSELIQITNKESIDEIKPILLFWDGINYVFSFMEKR